MAVIAICVINYLAGKPSPSPLPADDSPPPAVESVGPPVDEQEAMQFGLQLEAAVADRDTAAVEKLVPMAARYDRAVGDLDTAGVPPAFRDTFARKYATEVGGAVERGGNYKLVRVHTTDGRPRLVFRLLHAKSGMDYHDVSLARGPDGRVVLDDVALMLAGETLARQMRRLTLDYLGTQARDPSERGRLIRTHEADLVEFGEALQANKGPEALAAFRRLPDALRRDRFLHLRAVRAAQLVGDEAYVREIRAYRRDHPDAPGLDLLSVEEYLLTDEFAPALAALERVERTLGGDPCLAAVRATVLAQTGRTAEARPIAERAVKEEPTLIVAYYACIIVAFVEQDHAAALKWLKALADNGHPPLDLAAIVRNPLSKPFARSPQFQDLKAWYADHGK